MKKMVSLFDVLCDIFSDIFLDYWFGIIEDFQLFQMFLSLTQNDLESVFSRNFVIIIHHHYADGIDMQQDVVLQTLKQSMFETFCRMQDTKLFPGLVNTFE